MTAKMTPIEWLRSKMLIECLEPSDKLFKQAKQMEIDQAKKLKDFDTWKEWKNKSK